MLYPIYPSTLPRPEERVECRTKAVQKGDTEERHRHATRHRCSNSCRWCQTPTRRTARPFQSLAPPWSRIFMFFYFKFFATLPVYSTLPLYSTPPKVGGRDSTRQARLEPHKRRPHITPRPPSESYDKLTTLTRSRVPTEVAATRCATLSHTLKVCSCPCAQTRGRLKKTPSSKTRWQRTTASVTRAGPLLLRCCRPRLRRPCGGGSTCWKCARRDESLNILWLAQDDVRNIESGRVPVPHYGARAGEGNPPWTEARGRSLDRSFTSHFGAFCKQSTAARKAGGGKSAPPKTMDQERRKGIPWTEVPCTCAVCGCV